MKKTITIPMTKIAELLEPFIAAQLAATSSAELYVENCEWDGEGEVLKAITFAVEEPKEVA